MFFKWNKIDRCYEVNIYTSPGSRYFLTKNALYDEFKKLTEYHRQSLANSFNFTLIDFI